MSYVKIRGHRTWVRKPKGSGELVVLLHGGMSSSQSMLGSIGPRLQRRFRVAAFDRHGHGRTGDLPGEFSYDDMAEETIALLEHLGPPAHLVGHSDGGIVALKVALRRPDLLGRIVAVGANYHHDGLMPQLNLSADGPHFQEWAVRFGERSPDGFEHAREVYDKTLRLFATQPTMTLSELATIRVPTLIMVGDDDSMSLRHTTDMYEAIPGAQLAIVPGTSHAVLKEQTKVSARIISSYLRSPLPPVTYMPVRRPPSV